MVIKIRNKFIKTTFFDFTNKKEQYSRLYNKPILQLFKALF